MNSKEIDVETLEKLEASKKAVLKRVAERLKNQIETDNVSASHCSHSSGNNGRTHMSVVTA
ncbi:unannotated protein [freshwater metagenome]|uniref:Unannotated protein n=1 Tax=freshwater metagenome TaxID=449393 RepID=A0A6J6Z4M1_9ZZZZ|nr:hypothetical protein [Actinomycetota bacterium]